MPTGTRYFCLTLVARVVLPMMLVAGLAQAQDAHQIRVNHSGGNALTSASGMEVRGYAGSSWRENAVFEGVGLFRFSDPTVTTARVILNGITSGAIALGSAYDLVDFTVQVLKSPHAGGTGRNVNEVRLYQGDAWRANMVQDGGAGEYHIDVVDGADLRAYVIKDGMGRFTPAVRPIDSAAIDTQLQLVDFAIQVMKSAHAGGTGRNVNEVRLYQGDAWRANLAQDGNAGEYHIDVVDGVDLRAYVIKDGMGRFTPAVRPIDSAAIDTQLQLVDFAIQVMKSAHAGGTGRNVNEVRLYQGDAWRANLAQDGNAGEYHIDVVDGVDLRAYVIKDGMGRFTPAVRPIDSAAIDTQLQLVDFAIQVMKSAHAGGTGRNVNEVRLYQGNAWRANLTQDGDAGEYHIDVVDGVDLRTYVIKDGMGQFTAAVRPVESDAIDTRLQLVDFHLDVLASVYRGGSGVAASEIRLYQGNAWRANLAPEGAAGEYHIDTVDGIDVRAYVIKDGMGAFTAAVRPVLDDDRDVALNLVDYCVALDSPGCLGVPLGEVRLYQGSAWRANFGFVSPVQELHHDVVPGVEVRAWLSRSGMGTFSQPVQPGLEEDGPDQVLAAPGVTFTTTQPGNQARIYEGASHRLTLTRGEDGTFSTPLVEGMGELRFWINNVYSPGFTVGTDSGPLVADDGCSVTMEVDECWSTQGGSAAVVLQDLLATPEADGSVTLSWQLLDDEGLRAFLVQRNGVFLDAQVPVEAGVHNYSFTTAGGDGLVHYRIWGESLHGQLELLAELDHDNVPLGFGLAEAWPNPFNPMTRLHVNIDRERTASLKVYDMRGAQVAVLHQGMLQAGTHEFTFRAEGLASGVYFARLQSGSLSDATRLLLLK